MTSREARLARTARKLAASESYRASRRSYRDCLAGERFKPAKGSSCSEPPRDAAPLLAAQREREVMQAQDEVWPVTANGLGCGSGT